MPAPKIFVPEDALLAVPEAVDAAELALDPPLHPVNAVAINAALSKILINLFFIRFLSSLVKLFVTVCTNYYIYKRRCYNI